jgi:hypothetical protein
MSEFEEVVCAEASKGEANSTSPTATTPIFLRIEVTLMNILEVWHASYLGQNTKKSALGGSFGAASTESLGLIPGGFPQQHTERHEAI